MVYCLGSDSKPEIQQIHACLETLSQTITFNLKNKAKISLSWQWAEH